MLPPPDLARLDAPTTRLLLDVFAERYRLELAAEEDVFRTMPFFATGLSVAALPLGYLAQAFPWSAMRGLNRTGWFWPMAGVAAAAGMAFVLAVTAVILLLRATTHGTHGRALDERALLEQAMTATDTLERLMLRDFARVTPGNRDLNSLRYGRRSQAAQCMMISLLLSLFACIAVFMIQHLGRAS